MIINTDCKYIGHEFKKCINGQLVTGTLRRFVPSYPDYFLKKQHRYSIIWETKTGDFVSQQWLSDDEIQKELLDCAIKTKAN